MATVDGEAVAGIGGAGGSGGGGGEGARAFSCGGAAGPGDGGAGGKGGSGGAGGHGQGGFGGPTHAIVCNGGQIRTVGTVLKTGVGGDGGQVMASPVEVALRVFFVNAMRASEAILSSNKGRSRSFLPFLTTHGPLGSGPLCCLGPVGV